MKNLVDLPVNSNNVYKIVRWISSPLHLRYISYHFLFLSGDISEEAKHAYHLLIDGRTSSSPEGHSHGDLSSVHQEIDHNSKPPPPLAPSTVLFASSSSSSSTNSISTNTQSNTSSSSSSNQQKSDRHSHYSSTSTDNDISHDLQTQNELSPLKYTHPNLS